MTTAFVKEIGEQPEALRKLAGFYRGEGRELLARWRGLAAGTARVVFIGMGTSEYVAESVVPQLTAQGLDASVADAGEWLHYPRVSKGLKVLISQSGESVETRKVAERDGAAPGYVAITNNPASAIARQAGLHLPLLAGHETAITTKTYVNSLAVLHLMAQTEATLDQALDRLEQASQTMAGYSQERIEAAAGLIADAVCLHAISRGPAMAAAKQTSLTYMEGTRTAVTPFTGGTFRHGPFELVGPGHRALFFIPQGRTYELLQSMAVEVAEKGSQVVAITDRPFALPGKACVLQVPAHGEEVFPICAATTQELLLDAMARQRGVTAGVYRYGSKVTVIE